MDLGGLDIKIHVREARKDEAQQMLNLYSDFAHNFVGPALRHLKTYKLMLRRKERVNLVAVNEIGKIVGYISCRFHKGRREGRIEEVVVNPSHDFEQVATPLVEEAYNTLVEKKSAVITAMSIKNPTNERIFVSLGFLTMELTDVFMYTILNIQRFLNELAPIFISRLKKTEKWSGLTQIECEGNNLVLSKTEEDVKPIVWTNQPVDFKVTLSRGTLAKLIFSVADPLEYLNSNEFRVETMASREERDRLLRTLFPRRQFLILDHW